MSVSKKFAMTACVLTVFQKGDRIEALVTPDKEFHVISAAPTQ